MGCWRYCECGHGQSQIDIEDLQAISWDAYGKIRCANCGEPRTDDSPEERMTILTQEIMRLRERQNKIVKVLKYVTNLVIGVKP